MEAFSKKGEFSDRHFDAYRLRTGRTFGANRYFIAINPELEIAEGYDGDLWGASGHAYDDPQWTPEERVELADYMIDLWERYKVTVLALSRQP